ncbi:MAG TPA: hypothetical protein VGR76_07055 [Candidatus Angelobacter sp.]|jgi:hypothetical protein|nr:hypothetical protein [Candidatus Angelobacter sp.]
MKRFAYVLLALGLSVSLFAQGGAPVVVTPVPLGKHAVEPSPFPTYFMAELTATLDAAKVRPGELITAKLLEDTQATEKLPAGSTLLGRVIEARAHSEQPPQSTLSIVFNKARLKNGHEIPLDLAIMKIEAPPQVASVRRSSNDDFASLNSATARAAGPTTNGQVNPPGYPSRDVDYSGPIRDPLWDRRPNMPARNPSGLHDVEMTTIKQGAETFTVFMSDRRTVKLNKHYLVNFMIAQTGAQATPR